MAELSEWLELMLAEIARRQEEAQLNAEEEARRRLEASAAPQAPPSALQSAAHGTGTEGATDATAPPDIIEPSARRRRSG